jgi:CRISPR-associated exonuclease Cas4
MLLPLLLLALGLLLLLLAFRLRRRSGLPAGAVLASDAGSRPGMLLRSTRYGLHGRPDYLLRRHGQVIPVELKPSHDYAYPPAVMQLMAYCLLVEEHYGRPSHGLLILRDGAHEIVYSDARRAELLAVLDELRAAPAVPPRNHAQPGRCRGCAFAPVCTESLTGE